MPKKVRKTLRQMTPSKREEYFKGSRNVLLKMLSQVAEELDDKEDYVSSVLWDLDMTIQDMSRMRDELKEVQKSLFAHVQKVDKLLKQEQDKAFHVEGKDPISGAVRPDA